MQGDAYLDVAQVTLYVFWVFFLALILYLRREDKREGYPLVSDTGRGGPVHGFFPQEPDPKSYSLRTGHVAVLPNHGNDRPDVASAQVTPWPGAPFVPTGNPMLDGVGPGSWADREDVPELTMDNIPAIAPLRLTPATSLEARDADPRGMKVIGCDREVGGVVVDVWIDRAECMVRYLEIEVEVPAAKPTGPIAVASDGVGVASSAKRVLLPVPFCLINKPPGYVSVHALMGHQFADIPVTAHPDPVTKREEDRIAGYYGGGLLYATPARQEPLL